MPEEHAEMGFRPREGEHDPIQLPPWLTSDKAPSHRTELSRDVADMELAAKRISGHEVKMGIPNQAFALDIQTPGAQERNEGIRIYNFSSTSLTENYLSEIKMGLDFVVQQSTGALLDRLANIVIVPDGHPAVSPAQAQDGMDTHAIAADHRFGLAQGRQILFIDEHLLTQERPNEPHPLADKPRRTLSIKDYEDPKPLTAAEKAHASLSRFGITLPRTKYQRKLAEGRDDRRRWAEQQMMHANNYTFRLPASVGGGARDAAIHESTHLLEEGNEQALIDFTHTGQVQGQYELTRIPSAHAGDTSAELLCETAVTMARGGEYLHRLSPVYQDGFRSFMRAAGTRSRHKGSSLGNPEAVPLNIAA